jgi:hypothetical protein
MATEGGGEARIRATYPTNVEATIAEQVILSVYGIPLPTGSESAEGRRTLADVGMLYARLDLHRLRANALRALADHGKHPDFPIVTVPSSRDKISRRVSMQIRACNLMPAASFASFRLIPTSPACSRTAPTRKEADGGS